MAPFREIKLSHLIPMQTLTSFCKLLADYTAEAHKRQLQRGTENIPGGIPLFPTLRWSDYCIEPWQPPSEIKPDTPFLQIQFFCNAARAAFYYGMTPPHPIDIFAVPVGSNLVIDIEMHWFPAHEYLRDLIDWLLKDLDAMLTSKTAVEYWAATRPGDSEKSSSQAPTSHKRRRTRDPDVQKRMDTILEELRIEPLLSIPEIARRNPRWSVDELYYADKIIRSESAG